MLDSLIQFNTWVWLIIAAIVGTGIIIPIVVTGIISILGIIIAMFVWLHELIIGKNK